AAHRRPGRDRAGRPARPRRCVLPALVRRRAGRTVRGRLRPTGQHPGSDRVLRCPAPRPPAGRTSRLCRAPADRSRGRLGQAHVGGAVGSRARRGAPPAHGGGGSRRRVGHPPAPAGDEPLADRGDHALPVERVRRGATVQRRDLRAPLVREAGWTLTYLGFCAMMPESAASLGPCSLTKPARPPSPPPPLGPPTSSSTAIPTCFTTRPPRPCWATGPRS